jgi:sugar lactone lactonase YvrE
VKQIYPTKKKKALILLSTLAVLLIPLILSGFEKCMEIGDGEVFAQLPETPGFPEAVAIAQGKLYVTTPARFGTAGTGPSHVYVYRLGNGHLVEAIAIEGEDLSQEHALSGIAVDRRNRVYVISTQLGILRLSKRRNHYTQEVWSPAFPDMNPYDPLIPLPNDMVFDALGNLYITDSLQGVIWRVTPDERVPQVWFQSPALMIMNELQMGPNGIRLSPGREYVYFIYSGSLPGDPAPAAGCVYRLPLVDSPSESDLQLVYTYPLFDVPDGIAFDREGRLFVVMAAANAISILNIDDPDGTAIPYVFEENRLTGPIGSAIPYMQPANIVFSERSKTAYVVNHALFVPPPPNFFAVLKVYVDAKGDPLEKPRI